MFLQEHPRGHSEGREKSFQMIQAQDVWAQPSVFSTPRLNCLSSSLNTQLPLGSFEPSTFWVCQLPAARHPRGVHAASPSCGPPPGDQRRANYCFLFSRPCGSARRGSPSVRPTILCGDLEVAQARISVSLVTAGPSTGHIRPPRRSNASAAHLCFRFQVREQGGRVFHGTPNRRL